MLSFGCKPKTITGKDVIMKKIIITTLIATAFISFLLSTNVKPKERKQHPVPIIPTTFMTEKEKITTEPVAQPTTTTSVTTITTTVQTTVPETTTTTPPVTEPTTSITTTQPIPIATATTTPKNGTIEGDMIWVQGFGWIEYEGGGGIGYYDAEMYTNGNKIGYFG